MVMLETGVYLPLVSVNETFHLDLTKTNVVDGRMVVVNHPLFYFKTLVGKGAAGRGNHEQGEPRSGGFCGHPKGWLWLISWLARKSRD
ncbi:MAG: hypothetical protein H7A08_04880 [Oceanospirillaceae bacterium]|nr:hypothetical protein [Oceanospirillaceae bacterium]